MEAIYFEQFGDADVLKLGDLAEPQAGPGQIRIAVRAAGVNHRDIATRNGWLANIVATDFPAIPGGEASGIVDQVGEGVAGVAFGDHVLGLTTTGSYAEYALSSIFTAKPTSLSWVQAAALPVIAATASRDLDALAITAGQTLLINGASGGVGALAVQMAHARGATVIGTASPANQDFLRDLGAIPVAYGQGLVDRVRQVAPGGIDAVYDVAGKGALPDAIELRGGRTSRIISIADPDAEKLGIVRQRTAPPEPAAKIAQVAAQVADGTLRTVIAAEFPLAEAAAAMQALESGHTGGKVVLYR